MNVVEQILEFSSLRDEGQNIVDAENRGHFLPRDLEGLDRFIIEMPESNIIDSKILFCIRDLMVNDDVLGVACGIGFLSALLEGSSRND